MTKEIYSVPTNDIAICPEMQVRDGVDGDRVARYAQDIEDTLLRGDKLEFPPIELFKVSDPVLGEELWLVEGFHRFYAYQEAGLKEHDCLITEGTREEAILRAMTANYVHDKSGAPLTKKERQHAMEVIYNTFKEDIGYDIKLLLDKVKELGVSDSTARRDTKELRVKLKADQEKEVLKLIGQGMSIRAVAEAMGMDRGAVGKISKSGGISSVTKNQPPEAPPTDDNELIPLFGDESEETEETENPMEALNKQLAEREARREAAKANDTIVVPDRPALGNDNGIGEMSSSALIAELRRRLEATSLNNTVTKLQADNAMREDFDQLYLQMNSVIECLA